MSRSLFNQEGIIGGPHGNHYVYWVPVRILNKMNIKLWKHNRPADEDRIKEIHEHMKKSGRMDGILYIASINDELVCYESNHRRLALQGLDSMTATVLVDVLWDTTNEIVKDEFIRLNKAVSVPELYFSDDPLKIHNELKEMVDNFCKSYKSHKVNTNKPQRPNFNRDMLMDEFDRVVRECSIDVAELDKRLIRYNQRLMNKPTDKLSQKIIDKCTESGLWLFAWSSKLDSKELA